jgi:phosphohistidine phosphatase
MKTLYLLRHAHTLTAAPPQMGDHERILSPQGAEEARAVGRFMKKNELYPDFVLSSSATRTIQTTMLVTGMLFGQEGGRIPSRFDRGLYHASADKIISEIRQQDSSIRNLLLVAHNPGAAELALRLGQIENYAPATLAVFKADCRDWAAFSPDAVTLEMIFAPESAGH